VDLKGENYEVKKGEIVAYKEPLLGERDCSRSKPGRRGEWLSVGYSINVDRGSEPESHSRKGFRVAKKRKAQEERT